MSESAADRVNRAISGATPAVELSSKAASQYKMKGVRWLWKHRFALGKIGLIGGMPDKGKGLLVAYMIAATTNNEPWPCEEGAAPRGNAILFTAEDDVADTVIPRLVAAGADLERVHIIEMAKNADGSERMFSLATDLPALKAKIEEIGDVILVIIDPVSSYLGIGKINNSSTTDVRGVLAPLKNLAEEHRIAIIGIIHFNKKADITNAMLRIADSLAYVAAARHVYVVVDDTEIEHARLFVKAKNNLAPDKHGLRYSIGLRKVGHDDELNEEIWAPHILWHNEYVEITATQAMQAETAKKDTPRKDAKEILQSRLSAGPAYATDLIDEAKARSISESTLRRAAKDLGIIFEREDRYDPKSPWRWHLPRAGNGRWRDSQD
jgi:putative DNA primase/helicase